MKQRTNQGYTIIASISLPYEEYVLGEKQTETKEPKYVTWCCINQNSYYHGHYIDDKKVDIMSVVIAVLVYATPRYVFGFFAFRLLFPKHVFFVGKRNARYNRIALVDSLFHI